MAHHHSRLFLHKTQKKVKIQISGGWIFPPVRFNFLIFCENHEKGLIFSKIMLR